MKKIRVGQIGVLHDHAKDVMLTLRRHPEVFDIVGFVAEDECEYQVEFDGYQKNPETYYGGNPLCKDEDSYAGVDKMTVEELLAKKPDAVFIESFEKKLIDYAIMCAKAGIHIHIDKPAGTDIEAFKELIHTAKKNNLIIHLGYMFRYNPAVIRAKEIALSGRMGKICSVEASMGTVYPEAKRRWLKNFQGGMMYFLGCHLVDVVYMLMGVSKEVIPLSCALYNDFGAEDFGAAVLKYNSGIAFVKSVSSKVAYEKSRYIKIVCENGMIEIEPIEIAQAFNMKNGFAMKSRMRITAGEGADLKKEELCFESEVFDRYEDMLLEFAECVLEGKPNKYSYEHELSVQTMVLASVNRCNICDKGEK